MLKKCLLLHLALSSALNAAPQDEVLYPIVQGLKTGFINREGKVVIAPQFDGQSIDENAKRSFPSGLIPVAKDNKWGYVDSRGVMKIPFQFNRAEPFSEGLAVVRLTQRRNGEYEYKAGYVDASGKLRIEARFDDAEPFSEGLAAVRVGSKYGFIDKTGQFTIPPQFHQVSPFSEGLAAVVEEEEPSISDSLRLRPRFEDRDLWGFIDRSGAWKIRPRFRYRTSFHDGLAYVSEKDALGSKFINPSGETVAGAFAAAASFSEGLAAIRSNDGSLALIDPSGKTQFIVDKAVAWVEPFSDGLAQARLRSERIDDDKFGYIDRSGKMLIPALYEKATSFEGGLAFVSHCGRSGYIDKMGRPVWGIQLRAPAVGGPAGLDPQPSALTPARIAEIAGLKSGVDIKRLPASNGCEARGESLWTLEIAPRNGNPVQFLISLVRGESFLTEQRIEHIKALEALQVLSEQRTEALLAQEAIRRKEPIQRKSGEGSLRFVRPLGSVKEPIGYVFLEGFGPGVASFNASVFSPDKRYEVQVVIGRMEGDPKFPFDYLIWAGNVAMQVRAILFGATDGQ